MVAAALAGAAWIAVPAGVWTAASDRLVRACLLSSESAVRGVWGWASSHPWTAATLGALAGSLAWALLRLGVSVVGGWRMRGRLAAYEPASFPVLDRVLRRAPEVDPARVRVVRTAKPAAFTAGLVRPRIYVSAGLLESLTEDELRSVLRHEQAHAAAWDPARLAAVRFLSDFLWFLPVSGTLADAFSNQSEFRADDAAVAAGSDSIALAAAIVKTAKGALVAPRLAPALSGLALVEQRITRLLGRDRAVEATIPWRRAAASGVLVIGVLAFLLGPAASLGAAPSPDPVWITMSEGLMDCPGHHGMPAMPPADRCRDHG
jgi:Zn-dependent protease with chaperone function